MIRDGRASSARSKSRRSMPTACLENTLKFAPPSTTVAPSGAEVPVPGATAARREERADSDSCVLFIGSPCWLAGSRRVGAVQAAASNFEKGFRVQPAEEHHEPADEPGPSGLMTGAKPRPVVAME